jgi:hypothetical protein
MQSEAAPRKNPQTTPALLTIVGSVIALVGALLDWWTIGGTAAAEERTEVGTAFSSGAGALGLAVLIAILAVIMWVRGRYSGGRGWAIAAFILSLFLLFAAAYSAFAPEAAAQSFEASAVAEQLGISETQAEAALEVEIEQGLLEITTETGPYVSTAGGLLALIGTILGMIAGKKARASAAYAAPPVAATQGGGHHAVAPDQPATPDTTDTGRRLGAEGPGATGPGTPQVGGSTPADATGSTEPPHGRPSGGQAPPS